MWLVFLANILLIIALILLPDISIYYSPLTDTPLRIEYLLFVYTPKSGKKKGKIKHKRILLSLALDLVGKSNIKILDTEEDTVYSSAVVSLLSIPFIITKLALISFLRANAKSARLVSTLEYDALINIKIPLYFLFISLLKYPYYVIKERYRRRINE